MRKSTLPLLFVLAACGAADAEDYVIVRDFLGRSTAVECTRLPADTDLAVTGLRTASDSTVLVLDGPGRRVRELDGALRVVWELQAPAAGPGSLDSPVDAVVLGDTAVIIAERRGLQLIVYSRAGELVRSTPLTFVPHSLAALSGGDVLLSAMPMGMAPPNLLFRYDGVQLHAIQVPARPYADMTIGALGNSALIDVLDTDDALLVHQFMAPRAFRVGPAGTMERLRVPVPDAASGQLAYVPVAPVTEDQLPLILLPAAAMSVDRSRSEVYLLTRSGRTAAGRPERAILRLDDRLRLLDSYTIDVMARAMAFLHREGVALVVDDEDRFHACTLPASAGRHARVD
jgi:hypothetical protein